MKSFVFGLICGLVLVPLAVFWYFASGRAPVATASTPMPFERILARRALHARIDKEMPGNAPVSADEANLRAGAQIYIDNCAVCHGLPDQNPGAIARGMFPKPPQLFHGEGVTDDPPGETYWKVANGIRMTGMPGFERGLSTTGMWQVSLLLAGADKLPPSVRELLRPAQPQAKKE